MTEGKPRILYLEDDSESVQDFYTVLSKEYDVTLSAHRIVVETPRDQPFDLLILDLMIHLESEDSLGEVGESIAFPRINWRRTGLEFLRQVRAGRYAQFGIPQEIPAVAATAVGEYSVREEAIHNLGILPDLYLEKPFRMDTLLLAVKNALMPTERRDGDGGNE